MMLMIIRIVMDDDDDRGDRDGSPFMIKSGLSLPGCL
jgi:hypothetical protein